MTNKCERPNFLKYDLDHFHQRSDWDCGVSCILMVLPVTKRRYLVENLTQICQEEGFGRSTWTIDLCYLLNRLGMAHEYLTVVLGVNQNYDNERYYKNILSKDEERVNNRFKEAANRGIIIRKGVMRTDDMLTHLANHGPIILLTNNELLSCDVCKDNKLTNELRTLFPVTEAEYSGHYIVLCGYSMRFGKVFYRDPAKTDQICSMSFKQLDIARGSFGTDHDTILMFNKKKEDICT